MNRQVYCGSQPGGGITVDIDGGQGESEIGPADTQAFPPGAGFYPIPTPPLPLKGRESF